MANFFDCSFTVYDADLNTGEAITGGYILAAVFADKAQADSVLTQYRGDRKRYDVRPSGAGAVAEAALQIASRS